MRITNGMMTNNSLMNINANKDYLDRINTQMATQKKNTRPSDDPVVAIRALRLRGALSDVNQYHGQSVPDAQAWVSVTQDAISSTMDMLSSMRALCDQGANGTNTTSDREKIYQSLTGYRSQIYSNGNVTNAGRTVFTGFRTSEKLTFTEDTTADYRSIWDSFNASDVKTATYVESPYTIDTANSISATGEYTETAVREDRVNRIRLSYDNIDGAVKEGLTEGWAGDELGAIALWSGGYTKSDYFNDDGTINPAGAGWCEEFSISNNEKFHLWFNNPYDGTFVYDPEYRHDPLNASSSRNGDEIKIEYGDPKLTLTLTEDSTGRFGADKGASVKDNGDGTLTVTVPGANGTTDVYTEITVDKAGTTVSAEKCCRFVDANYWFIDQPYAGNNIEGKVFGAFASDTTELVYRTELPEQASIPQNTVETDRADGIQSFEIRYGSETIRIKRFPDEDRFFAVDSSGNAIHNIGVTQNTDKSFTVSVAIDEPQVAMISSSKDRIVFNVSPNAKSITSHYRERELEVQITSSYDSVALDSAGNELTAYQYLALDPNDKNSDAVAADKIYLLADTGELVFGSNVAATLASLKDIPGVDTIDVKYDKSNFKNGDLRPEHYFDAKLRDENHNALDPVIYDDHNQDIYYTVGTNQNIKINTNADDVFDPQIVRELDDILRAIEEYNAAEEKVNTLSKQAEKENSTAVKDLLAAAEKELSISKEILQRRYESGIAAFKSYYDQANLASTTCGTTDNRLALINNRLIQEKATVQTLASQNEDVDITNIAVEASEAELMYNAALISTGKIGQHTLMDYI